MDFQEGGRTLPPRERFTREMIIDAAYQIYLGSGMNVVTTRAIAQAMGGSTQPIFSQFATLDEVRAAVLDKAVSSFSSKHHRDFNDPDALLLISKHLIETVTENPHLLHSLSLNTMLGTSETYQEGKMKLLHQLMDVHQLTEQNANMLYMVIFGETIGILFAANHEQLENPTMFYRFLDQIYYSLLKDMKP